MTERYSDTDSIVGQFLPKVYTRRITLEDTKVPSRNPPRNPETATQDRLFRPATAITVDYQIKDVLDQQGLGIITNNQNPDEDPNQIQDQILSSLKVAVLLFSDASTFETLLNQMRAVSLFGWKINPPSVLPDFEQYLTETVERLNRSSEKVVLHIKDARPDTIGFEVRNSQYQEYDNNNNIINVIPYETTFKVENLYFNMCDNLSVICFTYFDFSSLSLDELSDNEVKRLGYMTGDISADVITRGAKIESTATLYRDAVTNVPYYGPVHTMGSGDLMTGLTHRENSKPLIVQQVPLTKIQDFRAMERLKETNYQPSIFQTFDSSIPSLDLIEKSNKNFFATDDITVDFDRINRVTNIEFSISMPSIYKRTRYYDLVKSKNLIMDLVRRSQALDLLEVTILRRRVTKRPIGHNKVSAPVRIPFDQVEEDDHIVATTGQDLASGNRSVTTKEDIDSKIMEVQSGSPFYRKFFVEDRQVADFLGTGATFQYGVELRVKDSTKDTFVNLLIVARENLKELNQYLLESSIPVFDSRMIVKPDPSLPISLDDVRDPPQYGDSVQQGNYDTVSKLLVRDFVRTARSKYRLRSYVENYLQLIDVSFAKSAVSMYNFSNPTQGNDGERGTVDEGFLPSSPKDLLMSEESMSMEDANTALYNMINPSNARPETIQSFIKTYQDLVMDLEDYFDIGYEDSVSTEGGGYTARGDNTLHMQRWFSDVEEQEDSMGNPIHIDSDNYIEMDPLQAVFFRYWGTGDWSTANGMPTVINYQDRLDREREKYFPDAAVDYVISKITPMSVVIGDDEIFTHQEDMKREMEASERKRQSEQRDIEAKRKAYFESKRQGKTPAKPRYKRGSKKYRHILATPEQGQQISTFLEELNLYQFKYGITAVNGMIGAMNRSPLRIPGFSGDDISDQDRDDATAYFDFMSSITEEMVDASHRYGDLVGAATQSLSTAGLRERITSHVACGIIDNRPAGNEVIEESARFDAEEGLFPGLLNQVRQLPPVIPAQFPDIPQVTVPNFPSGRAWLESGREVRSDRMVIPIPVPQSIPAQPRTSGPIPTPGIPVPVNADITAIRAARGPRDEPSSTPSRSRRRNPSAARRALESVTSATSATRTASTPSAPVSRAVPRSAPASRTSGPSPTRTASPSYGRTTGRSPGRTGPSRSGYGY